MYSGSADICEDNNVAAQILAKWLDYLPLSRKLTRPTQTFLSLYPYSLALYHSFFNK